MPLGMPLDREGEGEREGLPLTDCPTDAVLCTPSEEEGGSEWEARGEMVALPLPLPLWQVDPELDTLPEGECVFRGGVAVGSTPEGLPAGEVEVVRVPSQPGDPVRLGTPPVADIVPEGVPALGGVCVPWALF